MVKLISEEQNKVLSVLKRIRGYQDGLWGPDEWVCCHYDDRIEWRVFYRSRKMSWHFSEAEANAHGIYREKK